VPGNTRQDPECVHHWLLSPPLDGTVEGQCRRCGAKRAFDADPSSSRAYGRQSPRRQTRQAS